MKVRITYPGGEVNRIVGCGAPQCTPIRIYHPYDFTETVRAGSKEEHGEGGFEVLAVMGDYRVDILGRTHWFETQEGTTRLEFYEDETPPPPPPEPDDTWAKLFAQLDRIEALLQ